MVEIEARKGTRSFMISFQRGDLVIEQLTDFLRREKIDAAFIIAGIGSFDTCRMHTITTSDLPPVDKYINLEGPVEIGSLQGSVAGGVPHIHVVVEDVKNKKQYVGHLEEGSRCCYRVELGIIELNDIKTKRVTDTTNGLIDIVEA